MRQSVVRVILTLIGTEPEFSLQRVVLHTHRVNVWKLILKLDSLAMILTCFWLS